MQHLGDIIRGTTIDFMWNSFNSSGASVTRSTNGTVSVYKGNNLTQTTTGVTDTEDFDALTGVHHCRIVTTDAFYVPMENYTVVLSAATIDGQTVNAALAHFSIENRAAGVVRFGTAGGIGAGQITLAAEAAPGADFFKGCVVEIVSATTGAQQWRVCTTSTNANPPVLTLDENFVVTPTGTILYRIYGASLGFTLEAMADFILNRNLAGGSNGGRDVQSALRALRNKVTLSGGTMTVYQEDDSTPDWTATYGTAARDPLSSVDPA
jgi:hypothetical protein